MGEILERQGEGNVPRCMSGTGPDLWKAAPEWFHDIARQVYSVVIRLAVFPDQWKNEVIVPV